MKAINSFLVFCLALNFITPSVFAGELTEKEMPKPPVWEEYVPYKYQNPRAFPKRGKHIAELSAGIFLTDLLITAPIGIPMICHATTKLKNQGWYERKQKFEKGLIEAEKISNPKEREEYYKKLLKECKLTEEKRQEQLRRMERRNKKETTAL